MGEIGELVIGGVGLARYLDPDQGRREVRAAARRSAGTRAYRSGDLVRADADGLLFVGRADEQVKLGGRRIELGEVDAALQALPGVAGAAAAVRTHPAPATRCWSATWCPSERARPDARRARRCREHLPAALVPLLAPWSTTCRPAPRARSTGTRCPGRSRGVDERTAARRRSPRPRPGWPSGWAEILGMPVSGPHADFFAHGGGSLAAAQLVARIRDPVPAGRRSPTSTAPDASAAWLATGWTSSTRGQRPAARRARRRRAAPGSRRRCSWLPLLALVGLRWADVWPRRDSRTVAAVAPWAPTVLVVVARAGLAGVVQPGRADRDRRGRRPAAAARRAARQLPARRRRCTCGCGRPTRLAELSGATSVCRRVVDHRATPARSARRSARTSTCTPLPPVTGLLKIGRGAAVEPEVDLAGYWVDGDVVHIGEIRIGAGATVGVAQHARCPGARIGKGAEIAAGSAVLGAVPAGRALGGLARARGPARPAPPGPTARPPRGRALGRAYGAHVAAARAAARAWPALPALVTSAVGGRRRGVARRPRPRGRCCRSPARRGLPGRYAPLVAGRRAAARHRHARGLPPGAQPRRLAGLGHRAADGRWPARSSSRCTPACSPRRGCGCSARSRPRRRGVDRAALPKMTTVGDGAFLADDTMVGTYELAGGWMHSAPPRSASRRSSATPG